MTAKKQHASDPLLRSCPACLAPKGKGCHLHIDAKVVTKSTRLVHADRLEQLEPIERKP